MDRQADTALVCLADEAIVSVLDHQIWISNPVCRTCLWSHSCISKPRWRAKKGQEELWKKIYAKKDHSNNCQPTVMSEYTRHHNVKSWSKVLIKLHIPTASSEFDSKTQIPVHKALG